MSKGKKNNCIHGHSHCSRGCKNLRLEQEICPKCGKETHPDKNDPKKKKICKECGSKLYFCSTLRRKVDKDRVCPYCGTSIESNHCPQCNSFFFSHLHSFDANDWRYHLVKDGCKSSSGTPLCVNHKDFEDPLANEVIISA